MENQAGAAPLQPAAQPESSSSKKPWIAYNIIEKPGLKSRIWNRVGTAWLNRTARSTWSRWRRRRIAAKETAPKEHNARSTLSSPVGAD